MNILIVKLSAIGDVIHTLPSLAALRGLYPQAHITWVVEEAAADLIMDHPDLDRVIVLRRKSWMKALGEGRDFRSVGREAADFLKALRSRPYDLVVDFHGLFKSALVVLLSGGKRKLGYDSLQELSGLFLNDKIPEDMNKHAVDRYLDFIKHLGGKVPERPEFRITAGRDNIERVRSLLQEKGIGEHDSFIAVSPTALWQTKMWENEKFAALCDLLIEEGQRIVLTGARDDIACSRIRSMMRRQAADLSGRTTLKDLACLYRRASLLITTDSGPMHLAAAVGTPVVALFGPTSPARTGPYGSGHAVVRAGIDCSPCLLKKCDSMACMKGITVEAVKLQVQTILEKNREKLEEREP
jgi:heptosyltransferase-1